MKISKTHKHFSERLSEPRVLTNPEEFLGPNFEAVLNFWLFLDELSEDQWETVDGLYLDFYDNQFSEWNKAADEAWKVSAETIGEEFEYHASYAARDVYGNVACYATRELIGMHLILEQNKPLTFLQMFLAYE